MMPGPHWIAFICGVFVLIAVDLWSSHRHPGPMSVRRALWWSAFWIALSIAFGVGVWVVRGPVRGLEFFTGYLLEKSLSVDNLFVFFLIFKTFRVPDAQQRRVLTWGILGAMALRAVMIMLGIALIQRWHGVLYLFGAFLLFTGVRTLFETKEREEDLQQSKLLKLVRRVVPIVPRYDGSKFFTVENGKRVGTLLLLALIVIEVSDVIFAVDSIPAIFAVTRDPFIVFSSNILAILGLRALYFALVHVLTRLRYLHYGLGTILIIIGGKMLIADVVRVPAAVSFAITVGILAVTVVASLMVDRGGRGEVEQP